MEAASPAGHYKYLEELRGEKIRLIKLTSHHDSEHLSCNVVYISLSNRSIEYNALSYVWGNKSNPASMLCDGLRLEITQNLHQALTQVRQARSSTLLWVDAVCIDQANEVEKTAQVRLMTKIYSRAELVLVWLGDELPSDRDGLRLMQSMCDRIKEPEGFRMKRCGTIWHDLRALGLPDEFDQSWNAVISILTREWFSRIWAVQELVVARQAVFLCGYIETKADLIISAAEYFNTSCTMKVVLNLRATPTLAPVFLNIRSKFATCGEMSLLPLLWLTRTSEATDRRDKIFALVGLTNDVRSDFIDYKKKPCDLLFDLAEFIMRNDLTRYLCDGPVCLLSLVEPRPQSSQLPSWIPDWTICDPLYRPLTLVFEERSALAVGQGSFTIDPDKSLSIRGNLVDKLKIIVSSSPYSHSIVGSTFTDFRANVIKLHFWVKHVSKLIHTHLCLSRYGNIFDAYWRTLCLDGGTLEPAPPQMANAFLAWQNSLEINNFLILASRVISKADTRSSVTIQSLIQYTAQLGKQVEPFEQSQQHLPRRRFCITQKGYIGWVSEAAREGDDVAMFYGTRILFTLRREDRGFRLISDCYLQGLMGGEPAKSARTAENIRII